MRTQFSIAGKNSPFRLFPLPVVENEKFLIECDSLKEAKVLQLLLKKSWVSMDPVKPSPLWKALELHSDGRTQRFSVEWPSLHLKYLKESTHKTHSLEAVLSKYFSRWAQDNFSTPSQSLEALQSKIQAQRSCRICQDLGIQEVSFEEIFELSGI